MAAQSRVKSQDFSWQIGGVKKQARKLQATLVRNYDSPAVVSRESPADRGEV